MINFICLEIEEIKGETLSTEKYSNGHFKRRINLHEIIITNLIKDLL